MNQKGCAQPLTHPQNTNSPDLKTASPEFPDAYLGDLFRAIQVHRVMFPCDTGLYVTGIGLILVRYSTVGLRSY